MMIDVRSMMRPSSVRRSRRSLERRRQGRYEVEALEGRALLSLTLQTHPIPEMPGFVVGQVVSGPDGNLWFTEVPIQGTAIIVGDPRPPSGLVGMIRPAGVVTIFNLPTNTGPGVMTAGPDGNVWFVEQTARLIVPPLTSFPPPQYTITDSLVRITSSGVMTSFALPTSFQSDSSTSLVAGPDGNLWVVAPGEIGKVTTAGDVTVMDVGSTADDFRSPVFGPDGNLWVASGYGSTAQIDRITPEGGITRFAMPSQVSGTLFDLVDGPDGDIWFLSNGDSLIYKISTSGDLVTYQAPANLIVTSITSSPTNNSLWFTATTSLILYNTATTDPGVDNLNTAQVGRITTDGSITLEPAQSSSGPNIGPITFGPGGNLWYQDTSTAGPAIVEADFAPLTVTGVSRVNSLNQAGSQVVLAFSGPVEPTTAGHLDDYALDIVRQTRHGLVDVRSVAIGSASYDATAGTVTLRLARRLNPFLHYRITVNGQGLTGLASADGQHLSGAGAGHPGTNFQALVPHATRRHPGKT